MTYFETNISTTEDKKKVLPSTVKLADAVLNLLRFNGSAMTAWQVADALDGALITSVRARLNELERKGLLEKRQPILDKFGVKCSQYVAVKKTKQRELF